MELSQYGELFLSESREHVSAINHLLLALEQDAGSRETVEGVFRAVHTIKGMSATMGYRAVADLAHEMEDLLDRIRHGRVQAGGEVVDLLFAAADALERAIEAAVDEGDEEPDLSKLLAALRAAAAGGSADASGVAVPSGPEAAAGASPATDGGAGEDEEGDEVAGLLAVRFRVSADSMLAGVRAFMAVKRAREFGEVSELRPAETDFQLPEFDGAVRLALRTDADPDEVRAAIASVGEIAGAEAGPYRLRRALPEAQGDGGAAAADELGTARTDGAPSRARNIRVDLRRLDALMNQVGELVIVRDRLRQLAPGGTPELVESVDQAGRLIGELQDEIVRARMAPVWQVFDRFPRLVRDAARSLGKQVDFVIEGKEIELDRSMLDEIGDPLVHLLRNSLDHGIEPPAERKAKGKAETGTLRLSASRERSRVIIRVEDDGRGIQRERVLAKAVSSGLIRPDEAQALTPEEVDRLITRAGFSTAETVTDVSGRGVGLDVVATRVRALGGMLDIHSEPGRGTTFTLQLPLTLAIVRALLVRLGEETYALPLTHVGETTHLEPDDVRLVKGRTVALLRDEVIPLLSLRTLLGSGGEARPRADGRRPAVVLEVGDLRVGVEVDRLMGQQEIVVKSFDQTAGTLRLFSGATILSDGRPALILDAGSVVAGERAAEAPAL
ncbi:MAG: CheA signal transduction histidine kinase [Gemmatimonadetes bacterium]|nr:CheA signal transduction histidine kinase [Gemmatimonadota bacterium]